MSAPSLEKVGEHFNAYKIIIGKDSNGDPVSLLVTSDGYVLAKLMALDTESTQADVQVACDANGRLLSSGTLVAAVDDLEQYTLDSLAHYKISDIDDGNAQYDYFGFLDKDGNWYIMRQDVTSGAFRYAKGASGYNWSNRASKTYNDFATEF